MTKEHRLNNLKIKKKTEELFASIKSALRESRYFFTTHALERAISRRNVNQFQVLKILKGNKKFHESKKDKFDEAHAAWNYSIRGRTIDDEEVRIIISFDEENMLIITVINLAQ